MIIPDPEGFASAVLHRYFKHDKLTSFLRQLNMSVSLLFFSFLLVADAGSNSLFQLWLYESPQRLPRWGRKGVEGGEEGQFDRSTSADGSFFFAFTLTLPFPSFSRASISPTQTSFEVVKIWSPSSFETLLPLADRRERKPKLLLLPPSSTLLLPSSWNSSSRMSTNQSLTPKIQLLLLHRRHLLLLLLSNLSHTRSSSRRSSRRTRPSQLSLDISKRPIGGGSTWSRSR